MAPLTTMQALDRHALVMTLWLPAGLVAAALYRYGLGRGSAIFILAAFGAILAAFAGHLIVNALYDTTFTGRELALGLVLYAALLVAFGLATLLSPEFGAAFVSTSAGFVLIFASVVFAMVTRSGARGAFDAFDVIRTFRAQPDRPVVEDQRGAE